MKHPLWLLCAAWLLAGRMIAQTQPPEPAGRHALDCWVGEWEGFVAGGQKDGNNRIEKLLGGYALQENGVDVDRTPLTPLPGGRVRQVIEQSRDGGATWRVAFDAHGRSKCH